MEKKSGRFHSIDGSFHQRGGGRISKTTMVLALAWTLFSLGCGSDGSEEYKDEGIPIFVHYTGGMWKFEGGQRYWLKQINNSQGLIWEIG